MFIAIDLKVVEGLSDAVARAAGVHQDRILAGLVRLWHRVWADETDILTYTELGGVFGSDNQVPVLAALVAFGFLESQPGGTYRVRGSKRYLRLKESRRRGAQKTNALKRRSKAALYTDALERRSSDALSVVGDAERPISSNFSTSAQEEDSF